MSPTLRKTTPVTCSSQTCDGCDIQGKLLCNHTPRDLMDFWVLFMTFAIPFLIGMILGRFWWGLAIWFGLAVIFFGYVEALVLCRHCPHYAESGFLLRCHANWGLPKIPKFNPRPSNKIEKTVWLIYVAVLMLWYVPFFIVSQQWLLLGLTTWALFASGWTLQRTKCSRCYNLSCPVNRVPEETREKFFEHYPIFAQAWSVEHGSKHEPKPFRH